ncbi:MAG: extracellular solute-binding protein [Treponema sp.]|jgi:raffinose/stachyose/melibiose transport system substrate-binding protein|nr:extracellular solute-binding protein [Treponema sp.]
MKKITAVLLIAVCCGVALFAGGSKDKGVTLNVWHIWASDTESSKAPFENAVKDFRAAYPNINLVVDATENEAYKTKIRSTIAAGEAPDVFFYWGGARMKDFVDGNALLPLNDYLDADTMKRILPGTLDNMTFNGKVYGLPNSMLTGTFFVNEELFVQHGQKVPTNWDELVKVCQAFIDKGVTPFTVGGKEGWCIASYMDLIILRQAGLDGTRALLNKTARYAGNADFIEAGRKLQQLVDMGAFPKGSLGVSRDEAEVPFYEGKVPMYVNGSWTIGNVVRPDSKIKDKVKIYPFPVMGPKGNVNDYTGGVSDMFSVSSKTKYPAEAALAVKYITEHMSAYMYSSGAGLPTWAVKVDESKIDPLTKRLVEMTGSAKSYTLWWDSSLEAADAQVYLNNLTALFAKQITPQQFADVMQTIEK